MKNKFFILLIILVFNLSLTGFVFGESKEIGASVQVVPAESAENLQEGSLSTLSTGNFNIQDYENKSFIANQMEISRKLLEDVKDKLTSFKIESVSIIFIFSFLAIFLFIIYVVFLILKIKKVVRRKKTSKKNSKYL